ncbi:MAG TPA: trypsin-like peptidase domain-containing protein [Leptolyngbyaceae cyanobacterium]
MATLNEELVAVAEALNRSTVQVQSRRFGGGSGVIWHYGGLIITNAHVIRGMGAKVKLSDGRELEAVCIKRDRIRDLAALKVDATDLPAATIGDSDALKVGELVLAVGNPLGFVGAVTTGIIHATALFPRRWVEADIRLAPGNSGGALADAQGRVIGINTVIAGGLALAVPSNTVERFLLQGERPLLGVTIQPVLLPLRGRGVLGLLLLEIQPNSLAASAGLLTGDVLIGTAGQFFQRTTDLAQALWQLNPGDTLQLDFLRGGDRTRCQVQILGGQSGASAA